MRLQLKYNEQVTHKAKGAFIRGKTATEWLREINSWGIPLEGMIFFIMPESIRSVTASGLFVIFSENHVPELQRLKNPYGLTGAKLFLPVHAELQPEVSASELKTLLLWDCYVMHPSIGLVGFEMSNSISLDDFIEYNSPRTNDWGKANPGNPSLPQLKQISVEKKSIEEILKSLKESVGTKPLADIPEKEDEKTSITKKILHSIGRGILKGALFLTGIIGGIIAIPFNATARSAQAPGRTGTSNGLIGRLLKWMNKTLDELERERDTELKRLLTMFDHDTEEALAYAIPLNSPYMNRGTAAPSSTLGRRDVRYNPNNLGGGRNVDRWNVQRYYADLRNKYQLAAKKEIEAGNHKKAAYVYAHLLGDFYSAAKVLVEGKHYREAAALYKDHLKNPLAAAECLEKGGLLLESIELYKQLRRDEKVGDLYKQLGQTETAERYFNSCVQNSLANDDHLEAARIIEYKLERPRQAKETLLDGWKQSGQQEACLSRYFDLKVPDEQKLLTNEIKSVYTHHTPRTKRTVFLNVLVSLINRNPDKDVHDAARNIAYEIASQQTAAGNTSGIQLLRNFLPGDRLITSDTSRFVYRNISSSQFIKPVAFHQLIQGTKWATALTWKDQFIAIGMKSPKTGPGSGLALARINWEEFWGTKKDIVPEYHSWPARGLSNQSVALIADGHFNNFLFLFAGHGVNLPAKTLSKSHQFYDPLYTGTPSWLPKGLLAMTICGAEQAAILFSENNITQLSILNVRSGALINSFGCLDENKKPFYLPPSSSLTEMIYRNEHFYLAWGESLLRFSMKGEMQFSRTRARIFSITASDHDTELRIIAATENGCMLFRPDFTGINAASGFIASDMELKRVKYIPDNKVVAAGGKNVVVYDILPDGLQQRCKIETESPVVSILPTSRRNFCGLLLENGRLSVHDIQNV